MGTLQHAARGQRVKACNPPGTAAVDSRWNLLGLQEAGKHERPTANEVNRSHLLQPFRKPKSNPARFGEHQQRLFGVGDEARDG
jgi:hypothetical protein